MLMEWAKNQRPRTGETPEQFAERLMCRRKPDGFLRQIGTEFLVLQKWAARYMRHPERACAPDGLTTADVRPADDDPLARVVERQIVFKLFHHKIAEGQSPDPDDETDDPKSIGLYSSIDMALAAVEARKGDKGFRDWPGGFRIYSYPLEDTGWLGGYGPDPYLDPGTPRSAVAAGAGVRARDAEAHPPL